MVKAKRVLLLVTQADWGGVQAFIVRFASFLQAQGIQVLVAAGGEGRLWEEAKKANVPVHKLKLLTRDIHPLKDIAAVYELRLLLETYKPDAVHLNSTKAGVIGSFACAMIKPRPRTVYRIGGWVFLENISTWKKWLYRCIEKLSAGNKDVIITVHPGDERIAKKYGIHPREKIITVPNGLEENFAHQLLSREKARAELNLPQQAYIFGTVANCYPAKALLSYVIAIHDILPKIDTYACIIGGGPDFNKLKNLVDHLSHRERIILAGERADARHLYAAFDAFVLPSEKEGMSWALLEAMSAGLPCIATDVGANKWMLTEQMDVQGNPLLCGILIPPKDTSALHQAMRTMRTDKEHTHTLGEHAKYISQTNFLWSHTAAGNQEPLDG